MSDYAKWVGGGFGWMWGGPIGAFIGYQLGKYIGKNFQSKETSFEMSLLILSAMVVKIDGKIKQEELDCVRTFFIQSFGKLKADQYFKVFNDVKHKKFPSVRSVCLEINKHVTHKEILYDQATFILKALIIEVALKTMVPHFWVAVISDGFVFDPWREP